MKVDLFTYSADLQEIVINEYPGKIFEEQMRIEDFNLGNLRLYCFYNLDSSDLMEFIKKYDEYDYEIRNSSNGEFVKDYKPEFRDFGFSLN
jgi:hypothetical protein